MPEALFAPAFSVHGFAVGWLEIAAVLLSLVTVACNIREIHWGWATAIAASLMYSALFWHSGLYGNAALQGMFAAVSVWGWWQWLGGGQRTPLQLRRLTRSGLVCTAAACALLWPATALLLDARTDSDVPWWDAFPTAVSLVAQFLLGRKILENWALWMLVDVVAIGLYASRDLWLTVGLYTVFIAMCFAGWRAWARQL